MSHSRKITETRTDYFPQTVSLEQKNKPVFRQASLLCTHNNPYL